MTPLDMIPDEAMTEMESDLVPTVPRKKDSLRPIGKTHVEHKKESKSEATNLDTDLEANNDSSSVLASGDSKTKNKDEKEEESKPKSCFQKFVSLWTWKRAAVLFLWAALVTTVIVLTVEGYVEKLTEAVDELGIAGMMIFVALVLWVCQPYGWGYTVLEVTMGFLYGWIGMIPLFISTLIGCLFAFFTSRKCATRCYDQAIENLDPKNQLLIKHLDQKITGKRIRAYPILFGYRLIPLPLGIGNVLLALTHVSYIDFFVSTALWAAFENSLHINIGILIRQGQELLGEDSGVEGNENSEDFESVQVIVFGVIAGVMILSGLIYGRYVHKQIGTFTEEEIQQQIEELNRKRRQRAIKEEKTLDEDDVEIDKLSL